MSFLAEFWLYLKTRRKLWLAPMLIVMLALGGLIALAEGSAMAPFVYTLF